ncbi:MAG: hypothetical protein K2H29_10495 [Oscillospiraceae bacterium]|nr:hypothetical protein [Oscillospiraceae bacterium]
MKIKPKGRKIYRRQDRFEHLKHVRHSVGSVILTFVLAGIIGFVGYSAGAPILTFLQERNFLSPPGLNSLENSENSQNPENSENSVSDEVPENSENPENSESTTETETVSESETISETEPTTEPDTKSAPEIGFLQKAPDIQGYTLNVSALMTESSLDQALEQLPGELSHVVVPLKIRGGQIYYGTNLQDAVTSNAVQAVLPLKQIYLKIKDKGYEPVALVNTLQDDIYAKNYPACSYHKTDTGEIWEDQSSEQASFWMSPESSITQNYLAAIAEEIEKAGFQILICDGLEFPNFPRSELENLDPVCSDPDRWKILRDLLLAMRKDATELAMFVRIDGNDVLSGGLESLQAAEELPADCLLVTIDEAIRKDREQLESVMELSDAVPVMLEWRGEEIPKNLKITSYVLDPA